MNFDELLEHISDRLCKTDKVITPLVDINVELSIDFMFTVEKYLYNKSGKNYQSLFNNSELIVELYDEDF